MQQLVDEGPGPGDVTDELILALRAFVKRAPRKIAKNSKSTGKRNQKPERPVPSPWVLIFDCETTTTPDQRLRFGAYQLRYAGALWESGFFYDPDAISSSDVDVLHRARDAGTAQSDNGRVFLRTRSNFIDEVFYKQGFLIGAQIVGFNLPFDISRLAIGHTPALRAMKGGFSFVLSSKEKYPHVAVRHRSQKSSFIHFVGVAGYDPEADVWEDEATVKDRRRHVDRGYFVDVKTLAASLMSESHSLASLSAGLKVSTVKAESDEHGAVLTPEYVEYARQDVQTTYECFEELCKRFAKLGLADTGAYELYSEASLGKAYLKAMKIAPFLKVQPNFPPVLIGQIMSAYFGGRSEVHIRRQATEVVLCDFLSMYPTVCTLMGLWQFVRAQKIDWVDDTNGVRSFVDRCVAAELQDKAAWTKLSTLVQVLPDRDLFPVRAVYSHGDAATIGLNYLTSDEPLWFSLADVLVSKILTRKTPNILRAVKFSVAQSQADLRPVSVSGAKINPLEDDFYRELIVHRQKLKLRAEQTDDAAEKLRLNTDQQATKILANATSYGIFVELNVEDFADNQNMVGYGNELEFAFKHKKSEKPGRYFNPLLGMLITGAARLMLALAERQVIDHGLDWVFCDTDSMAIANNNHLADDFRQRVLSVTEWFKTLNPYGDDTSIFQIEKVNYQKGEKTFQTLFCLAISAKRYALFNRQSADNAPIIRKASGHGLGHLVAPYDEAADLRRLRIKEKNVPLWQEDLWLEIIRAMDGVHPEQLPLGHIESYKDPACSRYSATSPTLLSWFDAYNEGRPYALQVKPFNFLLALQFKSEPELAEAEMDLLVSQKQKAKDAPRVAAPYNKEPRLAAGQAFDRKSGSAIAPEMLKSHARSLALYHLHPEAKFLGGDFDGRGVLRRKHVRAIAFKAIGKEADKIEPRESIGDEEGAVEFALNGAQQKRLREFIVKPRPCISDAILAKKAKVSPHSLRDIRRGKLPSQKALETIVQAIFELEKETNAASKEKSRAVEVIVSLIKRLGRNELARRLEVDPSFIGRVAKGEKSLSKEGVAKLLRLPDDF